MRSMPHAPTHLPDRKPSGLERLPDSARLWIFGVSRPLNPAEVQSLLDRVDGFLSSWAAHGHPLAAARNWVEGRFLMVGVDDQVEPPSGCSIDALLRILAEVEREIGVEILGNAPVWYRDVEGAPVRVSRPMFKERAALGSIDGDTPVFDLTLTRVGDLRAGRFERPARDLWHARLLPANG